MDWFAAFIYASGIYPFAHAQSQIVPNAPVYEGANFSVPFVCLDWAANTNVCAGGNIIIYCKNGRGQAGNCDDNLAGVYPADGTKDAYCWQPANPAVDGPAWCAFDGQVYPDDRPPFPVPTDSSAIEPGYTAPTASATDLSSSSFKQSYFNTTLVKSQQTSTSYASSTTPSVGITSAASLPVAQSSNGSNISYPKFIRPSTNPTPDCDIFDPLCQPGSIIVEVNATSAITKTTVQCSYYLSAQSAAEVEQYFTVYGGYVRNADADYLISYGRSPQCTSLVNGGLYEECGYTSGPVPTQYWPAGAWNESNWSTCCGLCQLFVPQVQVFYWESDNTGNCSAPNKQTEMPTSFSLTTIDKRAHTLLGNESRTAVVDGYTFTSPSLYLAISGTVAVSDFCGQLGAVHTGLTIPITEGGLSTLSWDIPVGGTVEGGGGGDVKAFNPADIACPTWGIASPNGGLGGWTVGPPYMPIIVPPPEMLALNSEWSSCAWEPSAAGWIMTYGIFDPPHALTPQSSVDGISTPAQAPASTITPALDPSIVSQAAQPASTMPSPASMTVQPLSVSTIPIPSRAWEAPADPTQRSTMNVASQPSSYPPQITSASPGSPDNAPIAPSAEEQPQDVNLMSTLSLGAMIYSAFGGAIPAFTTSILTLDGSLKTATMNSKYLELDNIIISKEGSASTIGGELVSFGESGIFVGGSNVPFTVANSQMTLSTDGQLLTILDPSEIAISGVTVSISERPMTVSGEVYPVDPSGGLANLDSSTLSFGPSSTERSLSTVSEISNSPTAQPFAIDGLTFEVDPSGAFIAGSTLTTGGPPVIVSGIPVSLNPSDFLVAGTSTVPLPTLLNSGAYTVNATSTTNPSIFEGQGHATVPGMLLIYGLTGLCILSVGL